MESLLISVFIKAWLYLIDVILDGTCLSISSWHIVLNYSHGLLILVLTSIQDFTTLNISEFKFIISVFSKDGIYAG